MRVRLRLRVSGRVRVRGCAVVMGDEEGHGFGGRIRGL